MLAHQLNKNMKKDNQEKEQIKKEEKKVIQDDHIE